MVNDYGSIGMIIFLAVAVAIYFIPNFVATARKHPNANAIFALNLLLGWTVIGWVGALVWSLMAVKPKEDTTVKMEVTEQIPVSKNEDTKTCPFCAETVKKAAKVCRYCGRDLPMED